MMDSVLGNEQRADLIGSLIGIDDAHRPARFDLGQGIVGIGKSYLPIHQPPLLARPFVARKDLVHHFTWRKYFSAASSPQNGKQAGGVGCGGPKRGLAIRSGRRIACRQSEYRRGRSSAVTFPHSQAARAPRAAKPCQVSLRRAKLCRKLV